MPDIRFRLLTSWPEMGVVTKIFDGTQRMQSGGKTMSTPILVVLILVIAVVAKGTTLSGIHAKMMTSVDHSSVTQIRHRFACNLFKALSPSFRAGIMLYTDPFYLLRYSEETGKSK